MAEGGALLRRCTGLNSYPGFESRALRHNTIHPGTPGFFILNILQHAAGQQVGPHQYKHVD